MLRLRLLSKRYRQFDSYYESCDLDSLVALMGAYLSHEDHGDWCVESNAGTGVWRCHCSELPIKYYNQMADVFASGLPQSAFF
jgi:hypothetical protein